jgi:cyclophilin family peptidyl-prolyl cis-trans isomerase/protein-disulfide isomerase
MQKRFFSFFLLLVLLLSACTPKTANTSETTPAAETVAATSVAGAETSAETPEAPAIVASGPAECRTISMFSDEKPTPLPEVTAEDWMLGNTDAPLTILEYSDIQCPYCALIEPSLIEYVTANPDKVRLIFRHFPLEMHDKSFIGATLLEAAGAQGVDKFEALKNDLFTKQADWSSMDPDAFVAYAKEEAKALGIDVTKFTADLENNDLMNKILTQYQGGVAGGVSYTPYIVMNGMFFRGEMTAEIMAGIVDTFEALAKENSPEFMAALPGFVFTDGTSLRASVDYYKGLVAEKGQEYVDALPYYVFEDATTTPQYIRMYEILKETILNRQFKACPDQVIDPAKSYKAVLKTEKGDVTIKLFPDVAPVAVNSFVFLAKNGWFNDITFHRVIAGFVAQSGDPSGLGIGSPGYVYGNEINPDVLFDQPGRLAMANSGEGTNGSQFFITYAASPDLNGSFTIFGQVESGMDILEGLTERNVGPTEDAAPGDKLISVEIIEE